MFVQIHTYVNQHRLPGASHSTIFSFAKILVFFMPAAIVLWCQHSEILQEGPLCLLQTTVGPKAECSFPCPGQHNKDQKETLPC